MHKIFMMMRPQKTQWDPPCANHGWFSMVVDISEGMMVKAFIQCAYDTRPPMLEKGSYVPMASRFMRYLDGKKKKGTLIKASILEGPYVMTDILTTNSNLKKLVMTKQTIANLRDTEKLQYEADIDAMNQVFLGIPNCGN
ncbi:hypothetical protein Tco_1052491 [Tanacetum coccineum]